MTNDTLKLRTVLSTAKMLPSVARAICRVHLNGGDPDQPAMRWNGTQMEPQDFPAWKDCTDEAIAAIAAMMGIST